MLAVHSPISICPTDLTSIKLFLLLLVKKTALSEDAVVVAHKSAEGVRTKLSFRIHGPSTNGEFI